MTNSVFRRTPISLQNLTANPVRALVSVGGVCFALLLVFMQLGFRGAVGDTASIVLEKLNGQIVVRSVDYVHLYESKYFSSRWLRLIESHADVKQVSGLHIMLQKWQNPRNEGPLNEKSCDQLPLPGSFRTIGMIGIDPDSPSLHVPDLNPDLGVLKSPNSMFIDQKTKAEYGPQNCKQFSDLDIGISTELGGKETKILGTFALGTGLATNGAVLVSQKSFADRAPFDANEFVSLGVVQIREGANADLVASHLNSFLKEKTSGGSPGVEVSTVSQQMKWDRDRWLKDTPIGMIFSMGTLLALVIGAAIVYMILATEVTSKEREFATMKAIGYTNWFIASLVLVQAWTLALAGFILSAALAIILYAVTERLSGIPIHMSGERLLGVSALSLVMCSISGVLAVKKIWFTDPANLF